MDQRLPAKKKRSARDLDGLNTRRTVSLVDNNITLSCLFCVSATLSRLRDLARRARDPRL